MILLDTHVVLWLLADDSRLGPNARQRILEATTVQASTASLWEMAIKSRTGRLSVPDDVPTRVERAGIRWIAIGADHAWGSRTTSGLPHADPFDRLLLTQAVAEELSFLTADRAILGAPIEELVTIDARL